MRLLSVFSQPWKTANLSFHSINQIELDEIVSNEVTKQDDGKDGDASVGEQRAVVEQVGDARCD